MARSKNLVVTLRLDTSEFDRQINAIGVRMAQATLASEQERTPTVHYMPCPNHEAAIEVEGYCPCFGGLDVDWTKTDIWRNE